MKREEEIKKASYEYCDPFCNPQPTGDLCFRKGAEWADGTMIEKLRRFMKKYKNRIIIDSDKFIEEFKRFE